MRARVDLKSLVRENRPLGSVRGAPGNRRPYRDIKITIKKCRAALPVLVLETCRLSRGLGNSWGCEAASYD